MDFKFKGKSWAGNIYHQFESICQDVDDFMNKDTVKFVENQVQSVGMSVKRFYSNVVQDILPQSEDILKPEAQTEEQVDMKDHVDTVSGIKTQPNRKLLSVHQGSFDSSRNSNASLPLELDLATQFTKPPIGDPSQEAKTNLHLKGDPDTVILNDADCGIEENIRRDFTPSATSLNFITEIFSGISVGDHDNFAQFSAHEQGQHININQERTVLDHQKGKDGSSDISNSGWSFESKLVMFEDSISDENTSLSAPVISSADKVNEDNGPLMDSPLPPTCSSFSPKEESVDVSNSLQSPEIAFAYFSCEEQEVEEELPEKQANEEKEEEEVGDTSSICSTSSKSCNMLESISENFTEKAENICDPHAQAGGCPYNISFPSFTTVVCEKAVDMHCAPLILVSNDNNAFPTDGSDFVLGSSESRHEHHYKDDQLRLAISPSDTGNKNGSSAALSDLNMENVDLSPDVKRDPKSVDLNANFISASSHRKNFRYYKKLIQDAFTSRKRLSKEYKHLAILYGDIDMESSQHFRPSSLPSSPTASLRTRLSQDTCETEWELL